LLRLAVALLFTYPGVPCIYYGDEIGLGADLGMDSRQCMSWDPSTWDLDLRAWYKTLARLRRTSQALMHGGYQVLFIDPDTLVYQRDTDEEIVLVIASRDEQTRPPGLVPVAQGAIPDGVEFEELFTHQRVSVTNGFFPIPAMSQGAQVWVARII
jgi:alpha-glucosidase